MGRHCECRFEELSHGDTGIQEEIGELGYMGRGYRVTVGILEQTLLVRSL